MRTALALWAGAFLLGACGGGGSGGNTASPGTAGTPGTHSSPADAGAGAGATTSPYPHASEQIGTVREIYDGTLSPERAVNTYRNIDRLFPTRTIEPGGMPYPLPPADKSLMSVSFTLGNTTVSQAEFMSTNRVAGLLILKNGQVVNETYQYGNTSRTRWMSMSVAKSITSTLIGAAVKDGYIASIDDAVTKYVPRLAGSSYDGATVRDVMMMASGVKWNETYTDPNSDRRRLLNVQIGQQPGAAMELMIKLQRAGPPSAIYNYSTGETQVAGEIVYRAVGKPLAQYLSEKIWSRIGMEAQANWWLDSPNGVEIGGSGISATLRDYGRFGMFIMNDGFASGQQVLPVGWVAEAGSSKMLKGKLSSYGHLWWIPTSGRSMADGAFYANGIMGQQIYINRKERVVIVVWGAQTDPNGAGALPAVPFRRGCDSAADAWLIAVATVPTCRRSGWWHQPAVGLANRRYVWVPSLNVIFGGILVVQGHMAFTAATDASAIRNTRDDLVAFEEELGKAGDSAALIAAMTRRNPNAGMGVALQIGAKVAKGEMK